MKTFSHAIKAAFCAPNEEIELFRYDNGPGVITEQWYTGYECLGPNTTIRYYVDNDTVPYIEMNLYMAHGIGFVKEWTDKSEINKDDDKEKRRVGAAKEDAEDEEGVIENFDPELKYPDDPGKFTSL